MARLTPWHILPHFPINNRTGRVATPNKCVSRSTSRYDRNWRSYGIDKVKNNHFSSFRDRSMIFRSNLSPINRVVRSFFASFAKIWLAKSTFCCAYVTKISGDGLETFRLMTLNDLDCNGHKTLGITLMYLPVYLSGTPFKCIYCCLRST